MWGLLKISIMDPGGFHGYLVQFMDSQLFLARKSDLAFPPQELQMFPEMSKTCLINTVNSKEMEWIFRRDSQIVEHCGPCKVHGYEEFQTSSTMSTV